MKKLAQGKPIAKPKPPLEKEIQRQIVHYLRLKGWTVWQTSQGYRSAPGGTRMTPGLPDLYCLHAVEGAIFIEVKRPGQQARPAQQEFLRLHESAMHWTVPSVIIAFSLDDVRMELEGAPQ
jgi:hypothetical protein